LNEETITVTREHYERLKNERVALFGANNGVWTDVELEDHAVDAAVEAAGRFIEAHCLSDKSMASLSPEQFRAILQQACWKYMQTYVDYIPF